MTAPSTRTRVRRVPSRADYSRSTIDEALIAHLGFAVDGQPYVIPTLHARSAFHHPMNYQSVVVLGEARPVEGPRERTASATSGPE